MLELQSCTALVVAWYQSCHCPWVDSHNPVWHWHLGMRNLEKLSQGHVLHRDGQLQVQKRNNDKTQICPAGTWCYFWNWKAQVGDGIVTSTSTLGSAQMKRPASRTRSRWKQSYCWACLRMSITWREAERSLLPSFILPKLPPAPPIGLTSSCFLQSAFCFLSFQSDITSVLRVNVVKSPQNRPFVVTETSSFGLMLNCSYWGFLSVEVFLWEMNLFLITNLISAL